MVDKSFYFCVCVFVCSYLVEMFRQMSLVNCKLCKKGVLVTTSAVNYSI